MVGWLQWKGGAGNEWFGEFRRCDWQDLVVGDFGGMSNQWCTWGSDSGIQSFTHILLSISQVPELF